MLSALQQSSQSSLLNKQPGQSWNNNTRICHSRLAKQIELTFLACEQKSLSLRLLIGHVKRRFRLALTSFSSFLAFFAVPTDWIPPELKLLAKSASLNSVWSLWPFASQISADYGFIMIAHLVATKCAVRVSHETSRVLDQPRVLARFCIHLCSSYSTELSEPKLT